MAAFSFEEGTGAKTVDHSPRERQGTIEGAAWTTGMLGNALAFNGTTSHLRIDDPSWPVRDYTWATWVRPRSLRGWRAIVEIQTPGSLGVEVAIAAGGQIEVWSSGAPRLRTGASLTDSTWTHVAVTRRGSLITVYLNGVAKRAGRDATLFDFGGCPALIGVDADLGCAGKLNGFFSGHIDELKIYDYALDASEIQSLMKTAVISTVWTPVPPTIDSWLVARLAMLQNRRPSLDLAVRRGVDHHVLGGLWFGCVLFLLWVEGTHPDRRSIRRRTLTILFGSAIAILLTLLEAAVILWPPPSAHPELAGLYPDDFPANFNPTSFPSQSTALYAVVASGIYSVNKRLGAWAWAFVGVLVALPRVYLGGHYFTDILAGLLTGVVSYVIALSLLESTLVSWGETLFDYDWCLWRRKLAEIAIFLWIWAVTTGFRDAVVISNLLAELMSDAGSW